MTEQRPAVPGGMPELGIILVAAGSSTRMGVDKLWADLGGEPVLAHVLRTALAVAPRQIVVVTSPKSEATVRELISSLASPGSSDVAVVPGGARRRDSVAEGLRHTTTPWVAIHDAARPLVPARLFWEGLAAAEASGAAIPALPARDTVKRVAHGYVAETLPRAELYLVQTPQVFRRELVLQALDSTDEDATDEASLVEALGTPVAVFRGAEANVKITTPGDLALVRALLATGGTA